MGPPAGLDTFEKREKSLAGNRTEPRSIGFSDRSSVSIPDPLSGYIAYFNDKKTLTFLTKALFMCFLRIIENMPLCFKPHRLRD